MTMMKNVGNSNTQSRPKKNLIFTLGDERFGIPLSQVKEVIGQATMTPVPDVPRFFCGLINLRGRIISILELKTKLNLDSGSRASKRPCIIISEIEGLILGFRVDDVVEVIAISEEQVERNPTLIGSVEKQKYLNGVAKLGEGRLTLLLDLNRVLEVQELLQIQKLVESSSESLAASA